MDRLERALPVTAAVVDWLQAFHMNGSLLTAEAEAHKLFKRVLADIDQRFRYKSADAIREAKLAALGSVIFRVHLALALAMEADQRQRVVAPQQAALVLEAVILLDAGDSDRVAATVWQSRSDFVAALRRGFVDASVQQVTALFTAQAVRRIVEERYLGGQVALSPVVALEEERLLDMALRFLETAEFVAGDGPLGSGVAGSFTPIPELRLDSLRQRAEALAAPAAAELVERTRVTVLRAIGENAKANRLERRLLATPRVGGSSERGQIEASGD
jgi:hypothetical protein